MTTTIADTIHSELVNSELEPKNLHSYKVAELKDLCKKYKCKVTGTKSELVQRLTSLTIKTDSTTQLPPPAAVEKPEKKTATPASKKTPFSTKDIARTIIKQSSTVVLSKNKFGNYEHTETGFIFSDKSVIGKQDKDGSIKPLNKEDIETCNKYKFQFIIPTNLSELKPTTAFDEESEEEKGENEDDEEDFDQPSDIIEEDEESEIEEDELEESE